MATPQQSTRAPPCRSAPLCACGAAASARGTRGSSYQMLSLSATAMQGVNGWNFTTEGTPGFLLRKI